jgi:hypothetical protein
MTKEPKLKYKVDLSDLDIKITKVEIWDKRDEIKKGDIITIIDKNNNVRVMGKIKKISKNDYMLDKIELKILK